MNRTVIAGLAAAFAAAASVTAFLLSSTAAAAGSASGIATAPSEEPARFLTRVVGLVVADDYPRAWPSLYPAHQEVAPLEEYVACELQTPIARKLRSTRVLRVAERLRHIPGEPARVPVTQVTLRLKVADPALQTVESFIHTFSAVAVGGRWTWVLTPSRYELYRSDTCGT